MHQFILDNIETLLAIIVIAQGVILYKQDKIYAWNKAVLSSILSFMIPVRDMLLVHENILTKVEDKK